MALAVKALECPNCGAPVEPRASSCRYCAQRLIARGGTPRPPLAAPVTTYQPPTPRPPIPVTTRSRALAVILALVLGFLGVHRFYLGRWKSGLFYLALSWTGLSILLAWGEVVYLLCLTDEGFARRYPTG